MISAFIKESIFGIDRDPCLFSVYEGTKIELIVLLWTGVPLFAGHLGRGSRRGLERRDLDHYSSEFIIAAVLSLISPFSDWFVMQCSVSQAALNEHWTYIWSGKNFLRAITSELYILVWIWVTSISGVVRDWQECRFTLSNREVIKNQKGCLRSGWP